eukprot:8909568-Alexandrium_andersonii.AAC.1
MWAPSLSGSTAHGARSASTRRRRSAPTSRASARLGCGSGVSASLTSRVPSPGFAGPLPPPSRWTR